MIRFNHDYQGILEQLIYIQDHALDAKSPGDAASYQNVWNTLSFSYYMITGDFVFRSKINKNRDVRYSGDQKNKTLFRQFHSNYFDHRDFHKEMCSVMFDMLDIMDDYFSSDEYFELYGKYFPPFDEKKNQDRDLLEQYFKEKDIVLCDIFHDLERQGDLYIADHLPENRPMALFNSVQNRVSVFLSRAKCDVSFLASMVHELAHARDFFLLHDRVSTKAQELYTTRSVYTETLPTEYQKDFFLFLIQNNIHKEEAQKHFALFYESYLDFLDVLFTYSSLEEKECKYATCHNISRRDLVKRLNPEYEELDSLSDELLPGLSEALVYSYGILLSTAYSDQKAMKDQFLNIRHTSFDAKSLNATGLTPQIVSSSVPSKMKTYFKS